MARLRALSLTAIAAALTLSGCGGFITRNSDSIYAQDEDVTGKADILPGVGLGVVKFKMDPAQVSELIGQPDETPDVSPVLARALFHAHGMSILFQSGKAISLQAYSGRGGPLQKRFRTYVGHTVEGLTLRATRAEVLSKLGKPAKEDAKSLSFGEVKTGMMRVNFVEGGDPSAAPIESLELWAPGVEM